MVTMQIDEATIGHRIAVRRARRGLTQEELAGLVGLSLSMTKKIESGERRVTRLSQLVRFAEALHLKDLSELIGLPLAVATDNPPAHRAVTAVYSALLNRSASVDSVLDLTDLASRIRQAWQTWQTASVFRYDAVGQQLPSLICRTQGALRLLEGDARRRGLRLASMVYQLTRTWTKRVGEYDLSILAADRAVVCALDADDPNLGAAASWNLAMILSAQGEAEHATAVVRRAIEELDNRTDQATPARLAALGSLHLLGAVEAARADRPADIHQLLDRAESIAARTGETNYFRLAFGPTNVALHRLTSAIELGRTKEALSLAEDISVLHTPAVERRLTYRLDAAGCYARTQNDPAAVYMLRQVHQESPEELRYNRTAREMVRTLRDRAKPARKAELRPLVEAASLPD
jgi:transcriptional regulator with XRE-family HTH domain